MECCGTSEWNSAPTPIESLFRWRTSNWSELIHLKSGNFPNKYNFCPCQSRSCQRESAVEARVAAEGEPAEQGARLGRVERGDGLRLVDLHGVLGRESTAQPLLSSKAVDRARLRMLAEQLDQVQLSPIWSSQFELVYFSVKL